MHRIERYGVIALVLLLVTTAAVALWDSTGDSTADPRRSSSEVLAAGRSAPGTSPDQVLVQQPARGRLIPAATARTAVGEQAQLPLSHREAAPDGRAAGRRVAIQGISRLGGRVPMAPGSAPAIRPATAGGADGRASVAAPRERGTAGLVLSGLATAVAQEEPRAARGSNAPRRLVTVVAGDVLSVICERELGSTRRMAEVLTLNPGLDPDRLFVGQSLRLPDRARTPAVAPPAAGRARTAVVAAADPARARASGPMSARGPTYTVRPGDVLSIIAQRELGSARRMGEILALNPDLDADHLVVAQALRMPDGGRPSLARAADAERRSTALVGVTPSVPTTAPRGRVR